MLGTKRLFEIFSEDIDLLIKIIESYTISNNICFVYKGNNIKEHLKCEILMDVINKKTKKQAIMLSDFYNSHRGHKYPINNKINVLIENRVMFTTYYCYLENDGELEYCNVKYALIAIDKELTRNEK